MMWLGQALWCTALRDYTQHVQGGRESFMCCVTYVPSDTGIGERL